VIFFLVEKVICRCIKSNQIKSNQRIMIDVINSNGENEKIVSRETDTHTHTHTQTQPYTEQQLKE